MTIPEDDKRCTALKQDGSRCTAPRALGLAVCVFHNPNIPESVRAEKRAKGGRTEAWLTLTHNGELAFEDIVGAALENVENLRRMRCTPQVSNAMTAALHLLKDLYELRTLGARADQIESMLQQMQTAGLIRKADR